MTSFSSAEVVRTPKGPGLSRCVNHLESRTRYAYDPVNPYKLEVSFFKTFAEIISF